MSSTVYSKTGADAAILALLANAAFVEAVQDLVAAMIVDGTNMSHSYNDAAGQLTLTSAGAGGGGGWTAVDATELVKGIAELATQTETNTGTDDARIVTPLKLATRLAALLDATTTLGTSNTVVPTQGAVKAYADALLDANNAMQFKGVIDCSSNPNYPAASAGHTYKVSVAGKIGGASGTNVEVGDTLYCTTDATAAGTQAAVGANWVIVQTNVDGAVVGPGSSTAGNIPTFSGTTGKVLQDSGMAISAFIQTLIDDANAAAARTTLGAASSAANMSRATAASSGTPTPAVSAERNLFALTALAANATFGAPTGSPSDGDSLMIRIKDNGTSRTLAWNAAYRAVGIVLPTATTVSKTLYVAGTWNAADSKWDMTGLAQEA